MSSSIPVVYMDFHSDILLLKITWKLKNYWPRLPYDINKYDVNCIHQQFPLYKTQLTRCMWCASYEEKGLKSRIEVTSSFIPIQLKFNTTKITCVRRGCLSLHNIMHEAEKSKPDSLWNQCIARLYAYTHHGYGILSD